MSDAGKQPWPVRVLGALLALGILCALWAFFVEPDWIELSHHTVVASPESGLRAPLRIAHVTDLHTEGMGGREEKVMRLLRQEAPDVIVVTGDTVTTDGTGAGYRAVWSGLVGVGARRGVLNVRGNWEYWVTGALRTEGRATPAGSSERMADSVGVLTLVNRSTALRDDLWVLGLDDPLAGQPDREATRQGVPGDVYRVGLMHSPEIAGEFAQDVDLVLAGHSHGGQIVLPLLGSPYLPPGVGTFVGGWYEEHGTPIFVSRGIGTSVLPVRFNCRPELAIIDLVPAE
ncbi:MAG: metallophosphoesterase [Deltaproteobacteria bacterium]|nr:metallophosphoesterase [Deltaproteobacteria bacterium]